MRGLFPGAVAPLRDPAGDDLVLVDGEVTHDVRHHFPYFRACLAPPPILLPATFSNVNERTGPSITERDRALCAYRRIALKVVPGAVQVRDQAVSGRRRHFEE